MGSEWTYTPLYQVAKLTGGFAFKSKDFISDGVPVAKIKNVRHRDVDLSDVDYVSEETAKASSKFLVKHGDILISMTGSGMNAPASIVGRVARHSGPNNEFLINQRVGRFSALSGDELDLRFLYYYFSQKDTQLELVSIATGSANQVNLSATQIESLEIPLPPLPEQKAIAHILGSLDDKIELNRKMNATLEAMAQALFKSWFVDFDPVIDNILAKNMSRNQPSPNLSRGERNASSSSPPGRSGDEGALRDTLFKGIPEALIPRAEIRRKAWEHGVPAPCKPPRQGRAGALPLPDTHKLFPSAFVETGELGPIPEGWEVSTIGEEVDTVGGGTPSTKNPDFWEGGKHPWVTPKAFSALQDKVLLSSSRYLTEAGLAKISSGLLPKGTVLMSSRAPVGYLAITQIETAINQGFIAMICNKRLPPEFVLQWANSTMDDIKGVASGSTFAEISKKAFRPFEVLVPSDSVLEAYKKLAAPLYERISDNVKASETLTKLRDTLLPKLISGELRIPEAEQLTKEVLV